MCDSTYNNARAFYRAHVCITAAELVISHFDIQDVTFQAFIR
jgi:hypothetical protein